MTILVSWHLAMETLYRRFSAFVPQVSIAGHCGRSTKPSRSRQLPWSKSPSTLITGKRLQPTNTPTASLNLIPTILLNGSSTAIPAEA